MTPAPITSADDSVSLWDGLDLAPLLSLEAEGQGVFTGRLNQLNAYHVLFGGQILGQALIAASTSAPGRALHSMHAYFLRPGTDSRAVRYRVERVRDGRSFSVRQVQAFQGQERLFLLSCSFHVGEEGWSHQQPMAAVPPPEQLADLTAIAADLPPGLSQRLAQHAPAAIEVRPVQPAQILQQQDQTRRQLWFRAPALHGVADQALHRASLALMTDYWISGAARVSHTSPVPEPGLTVASLDHAMWFHRDVDTSDWLLLDFDSPSAEGGIGLSRGVIHDRNGRMVATAAQESLQRVVG